MRKIFTDIGWEVKAGIFAGMVVIFTMVGPFGTYTELTVADRLSYWTGLIFFVAFFVHVCIRIAMDTPLLGRMSQLWRVWLGVAVGSAPAAAMAALIDRVYRGTSADLLDLTQIWAQIAAISAVIAPFEFLRWSKSEEEDEDPPVPLRTRFHERLTHDLGTDIISLSMQDHYVEVTTTQGTGLILMRMRDALDELQGLPGVQLHRSHWAARSHLERMRRDKGKNSVQLSDGRRLPVSNTYLSQVEATFAD